jgi:hypothetical protein
VIDFNISECDLPVYAYDFRQRALLTFDGKEVTGGASPIFKVWAMQPLRSFLSSIKPLAFWSTTPVDAAAPYIFARVGGTLYRFSRVDYTLAHKRGLKGEFDNRKFVDPDFIATLSSVWYTTAIQAWQAGDNA